MLLQNIFKYTHRNKAILVRGWEDSSVTKNTLGSRRELRFGSHSGLQFPVTPVPEDLMLCLASMGNRQTHGTLTDMKANTHAHKIKKHKSFLNVLVKVRISLGGYNSLSI